MQQKRVHIDEVENEISQKTDMKTLLKQLSH